MSSLNIEQFIEMVRKRPLLWDRNNKFHSNRNMLEKNWTQIATELKVEEHKIRRKWKYLRDQFAVEYGKIPPTGCVGDVLWYEPRWRYYKNLQFLEEVVTPRVNSKNPRREDDSTESQDTSAPNSPSPADNAVQTANFGHRALEAKKRHIRHLREKQKLQRPTDSVNDEHLHFFKSLLPHVRNIPPHLQLSFRNRVQAVVEEFAYRSDPTATTNSENPSSSPKETYFITCVEDHETKFEPPESVETQDSQYDDDSS